MTLLLVTIFAYDSSRVGWRDLQVGGGLITLPLARTWGVFPPAIRGGEWWRLITAGFVHANVLHIGLNLVGLLYAGSFVEQRFGRLRWLLVYAVALVAGNVLAFITSDDRTTTIGASGAIMGLFGAFGAFGALFWSQRDELGYGLAPAAATLVNGLLQPGISNAGHVGGLAAGFVAAVALGASPDLTRAIREGEARSAQASEEVESSIRKVPDVIANDPANRMVIRRTREWRYGGGLAAAAAPIVAIALAMNSQFVWAAISVVFGVLAGVGTRQQLELTPLGAGLAAPLFGRSVAWRDVERFFPYRVSSRTVVGFAYTPAYTARRERSGGVGRFVTGGTQNLGSGFEVGVEDLIPLLEQWRMRWTTYETP